ncbi:MAG: ABC transporter permease [Clostridia bacterium]|nr:ABC transporter permease [Clostridia bacterium]
MFNMILADLFKMYKSSAIKILFGITTFCAAIMVVFANLIPQGKIGEEYTGIGFMLSDISMMSILGAAIAGIFICGDFDNKTIHNAIAGGYSRGVVIVSKAIVFFCAVGFILLPYAIITGIALGTGLKFDMGAVSVGFLNILSKDSGVVFTASVLLKLLAAAFTLMLVYMAQLSICVPFALLFKKPVLVVVIYYLISILTGQVTALRHSSQVLDNIFLFTPFGGNYNFVTLSTGTGDFIKAIAVSVVFIIAMIAMTYSIFRKSEIK